MKPNVGEKERLYRTILGVYGLLLGFLFLQGIVGIILGILGLVSLVTGMTGWCPIYQLVRKTASATSPENVEES
ncbi:MAG: DUF2892 domain-containing protein [Anaerolineae bacterium]|nr:DUF2892 domain-containing protein [Anaerolineae bacterium]